MPTKLSSSGHTAFILIQQLRHGNSPRSVEVIFYQDIRHLPEEMIRQKPSQTSTQTWSGSNMQCCTTKCDQQSGTGLMNFWKPAAFERFTSQAQPPPTNCTIMIIRQTSDTGLYTHSNDTLLLLLLLLLCLSHRLSLQYPSASSAYYNNTQTVKELVTGPQNGISVIKKEQKSCTVSRINCIIL